jgi:hypothetical protein
MRLPFRSRCQRFLARGAGACVWGSSSRSLICGGKLGVVTVGGGRCSGVIWVFRRDDMSWFTEGEASLPAQVRQHQQVQEERRGNGGLNTS